MTKSKKCGRLLTMDTRDSVTKQKLAGTYDRNLHIKELRQYGFTFDSIGKRYNLSRQRIEQIAHNPFDTHQNEHKGSLIRKLIAKVKRLFHTDISIGG